jgi:putative acetyltransferase
MDLNIRKATDSDTTAIDAVIRAAFDAAEGPEIARLAAALAQDPTAAPQLTLVAMLDAAVVGVVAYSGVRIEGAAKGPRASILAPLAVRPDLQRRGIGRGLVEAGCARLAADGVGLVFVLGDPAYYGRLGFVAAEAHGLVAPHPLAPAYTEAWRVRALQPDALGQCSGRVGCAISLSDPKLWRP